MRAPGRESRRDTLRSLAIGRAILAMLLTGVAACSDERGPTGVNIGGASSIASEPVSGAGSAQVASATISANALLATSAVYVSLPSGTVPSAALAVVKNVASGLAITRPIVNGGLDPVPVAASVGDRLEVTISGNGNAILRTLNGTVPSSRKPYVVRTIPPRRKTDVPLNARLIIVFSEPIRPTSAGSIRLLRANAQVSGSVVVSADGLRAELQPAQLLAANTDYVLSVSSDVRDLSGDPLEEAVTAEFTTGSTVAVASVTTEEPALILNPFNNEMRMFEAEAIQDASGKVSGNFSIFYGGKGWRVKGRVTCFAVVDGKTAWVAGIVEEASNLPEAVGTSQGWRAEDNGPPGVNTPDRLSFSHDLVGDGTAAARQDFCANKPLVDPSGEEITLYDLLSGNIVVAGATIDGGSAPEPPEVSTGLLAYFGDAGIYVTNPAGQFPTRMLEREIPGGHRGLGLSWSPDGARIAFAAPRFQRGAPFEPSAGVFVVNSDGTGLIQLTHPGGIADDIQPAWSPDGRQIAFVRFGENGNAFDPSLPLYVIRSDGSGLRLLTSDGERPAWSPDSKRLAFTRRDGIYVINADGTGLRRLTTDGDEAAWSPDGTKIAFVSSRTGNLDIYVMNADGSGARQLTTNSTGDYSPAWSPDGARIAFTRESSGWGDLFVMRSDGSNEVRLTNTPYVQEFRPSWSTTAISRSTALAVQPAPGSHTEMQIDTVYATLPHPLQVRVLRDGRPASGVTVRWTVTGGSVSETETTTDVSGIASVLGVLSGPAPQDLHAEASVLGAIGSPVVFRGFGAPGRPARIRFDQGWTYDPERNPYRDNGRALVLSLDTTLYYGVETTDRHGNPVGGQRVDFAVISGGGTVTTEYREDEYCGCTIALTKHTLGKDPRPQSVTATASELEGAPQVTFTAIPVSAIVVVDWEEDSGTCSDFCPANVSVATGATVGWRLWSGTAEHNVTFEDDPTQPVSSGLGHIHTRTFNAPGVYRYRCTLHSTDFSTGEVGTVTVR